MKKIIVNNGSTSKKYALYDAAVEIYFAHYEMTPEGYVITEFSNDEEREEEINESTFKKSFLDFLDRLLKNSFISSEDDIGTVSFRIVAPGKLFQENKIIDKKYLVELEDKFELSPLHIKPIKEEIFNASQSLPNIEMVAISDSFFHKTMSMKSKMYALPIKMTEKLELYRFGYHGLSVESIVDLLKVSKPKLNKIIVCHLGGGSSITAVKNGKSVDTTMGFSPLEGIPMSTRAGNVDPNALVAMMDSEDFDTKELQDFLYHKCGMKGISGVSGDTRVIIDEIRKGNENAKLALDVYTYQIIKWISSVYCVLDGIDAIVFTGTIGVRSTDVRQKVCEGLSTIGVSLDLSKNKLQIKGAGDIHSANSKIQVIVQPTNEMRKMAETTDRLLKKS